MLLQYSTANWMVMSVVTGLGATVSIDLWSQLLKRVAGVPATDWGMVGRWLFQIARERIFLLNSNAATVPYERSLGWAFHYMVGAVYGFLYITLLQITSLSVSFWSGLAFGLITVLAPWLILQPALGKGRFASKTPDPKLTRVLNLLVHSIFGISLYMIWIALPWK